MNRFLLAVLPAAGVGVGLFLKAVGAPTWIYVWVGVGLLVGGGGLVLFMIRKEVKKSS